MPSWQTNGLYFRRKICCGWINQQVFQGFGVLVCLLRQVWKLLAGCTGWLHDLDRDRHCACLTFDTEGWLHREINLHYVICFNYRRIARSNLNVLVSLLPGNAIIILVLEIQVLKWAFWHFFRIGSCAMHSLESSKHLVSLFMVVLATFELVSTHHVDAMWVVLQELPSNHIVLFLNLGHLEGVKKFTSIWVLLQVLFRNRFTS